MSQNNSVFSVTLINEEINLRKTIPVRHGEYILDAVKEPNVDDLPYSCRAGCCTSCVGKIIEGTVEQSYQALHFLTRAQVEAGYILTCAAYPTSDCKILTHQEDEIF